MLLVLYYKLNNIFQWRIDAGDRIGYIVAVNLCGEGWRFQFLHYAFYIHSFVLSGPDQCGSMHKTGELIKYIDHFIHGIIRFYAEIPGSMRCDAVDHFRVDLPAF